MQTLVVYPTDEVENNIGESGIPNASEQLPVLTLYADRKLGTLSFIVFRFCSQICLRTI